MNDSQKTNIRELALTALLMINEEGRHSNTVINDALDKYDHIDPRDRALLVRLVHGSLEYRLQSDHIIGLFCKIGINKMKPVIREVLRMSIYQIMHMDRIPDSAVCDEAVKLIKKSKYRDLAGFVNAVLRNVIRHRGDIDLSEPELYYSTPEWLIRLIADTVGEENAKNFLEYSLEYHGVSVRTVGTDELRTVMNAGVLTELPEWKAGKLTVQDHSSAQPVIHSGIKPGDTVIDVCAAPGGKSIQAAEKGAHVIACDISKKKTDLIRENVGRFGIENIEIKERDATVHYDDFDGKADILLADLPCSGIGTISRKPDVKNRVTMDDCRALSEMQKKILNNVQSYVKPGGKLVYSTCTIDHFENEDVTAGFLKNHRDYTLISECMLLPGEISGDGFYYAIMKRNAEGAANLSVTDERR